MASRTSPADAMAAELREIIRHAGALVDATADEADERVQKVREQLEKRLDAAKSQYADLDDLLDPRSRPPTASSTTNPTTPWAAPFCWGCCWVGS